MPKFMVMSLAAYTSGIGVPTLIDGVDDIYSAAAQCAVDEEKNSAQYVVYTMDQWQNHQAGRAVTVEIQGKKRTATWFPSSDRPHPADVNAPTRIRVLDKTPKEEPQEEEPEPVATTRRKR